MRFRLTIYTESGRMHTDAAPVTREQIRGRIKHWQRENDGERFAFALLLGAGAPGLNNVYGIAIPLTPSLQSVHIRTVQHVQLALTPPPTQRLAHG